MSRKKRMRNQTPAETGATPSGGPAKPEVRRKSPADMRAARRLAFLGYALCGLLLGLLTGINRVPEPPAELTSPLSQAAFAGAVLGWPVLNWSQGVEAGTLGLVVGGCLGYSLGLEPARLIAGWVLGGLGLGAFLGLGKGLLVGAAGGLLGFVIAVRARVPEASGGAQGNHPLPRPHG